MSLIRRRVYALPDARYIMGEIERGRLYADGILWPPPPRTDWKGRVKARISDFILRAVRLNFRFQEVYNHAGVGVLQLIAEDLYTYEKRLNAEGRWESRPAAANGFDSQASASTSSFDRAAYEEKYLDSAAYCDSSLSIARELLGESDLALELYCGRGELLAAFAANGIEAVGVDPDASMVSLCLGRGASAIHADIFDYLNSSPDESFGGIFTGRAAERLTNEQTVRLLGLAAKKLRRGGVLAFHVRMMMVIRFAFNCSPAPQTRARGLNHGG